jgi:TonB family protein
MGVRHVMFLIPLLFGGINNPDKAIGKLEKTCADGRSAECATAAEFFLLDNHMTSSAQRATDVLESVCKTEHKRERCEWPIETMACRRVGEIYAMGQGVPRDVDRGLPFLERASDAGDALASVQLGRALEKLKQDDKARERYALGCRQTDFLTTECGIGEARVKAYQEQAAFGCQRSTADWTVPKTPTPEPVDNVGPGGLVHVTENQGPRKIKDVPPRYPAAAISTRLQGRVVMQATIDVTGHVSGVEVISGPPILIEAAVSAVKQWVYTPYLIDGKPVPVVMTTTVGFRLQ